MKTYCKTEHVLKITEISFQTLSEIFEEISKYQEINFNIYKQNNCFYLTISSIAKTIYLQFGSYIGISANGDFFETNQAYLNTLKEISLNRLQINPSVSIEKSWTDYIKNRNWSLIQTYGQ